MPGNGGNTVKKDQPNLPISRLFDELRGGLARLHTLGWFCTCGGQPGQECEHIKAAKKLYKIEQEKLTNGSDNNPNQ